MIVEALLDERLSDPAERRRCLTTLHREIGRLDRLVGRLIELLRIEGSREPFERGPIAVDSILRDSLAAFELMRLEADTRVKTDLEPGLEVLGDRAALTQVFVNLMSNAWQHGGADTRIEIRARRHRDREVEVTVAESADDSACRCVTSPGSSGLSNLPRTISIACAKPRKLKKPM